MYGNIAQELPMSIPSVKLDDSQLLYTYIVNILVLFWIIHLEMTVEIIIC